MDLIIPSGTKAPGSSGAPDDPDNDDYDDDNDKGGMSVGTLAGILFGVLGLIALAAVIIVCYCKKRQRVPNDQTDQPMVQASAPPYNPNYRGASEA